jgi:hypothetical protein
MPTHAARMERCAEYIVLMSDSLRRPPGPSRAEWLLLVDLLTEMKLPGAAGEMLHLMPEWYGQMDHGPSSAGILGTTQRELSRIADAVRAAAASESH